LTRPAPVLHNAEMAIQAIQGPCFPPLEAVDSNGLLMLGGDLSVDWILTAYRQGIFPWPIVEGQMEILAWFSPDPRAILELDQIHVSRRLARKISSGRFQVTSDQAFDAVLAGCAGPRQEEDETWITPGMKDVFQELHGLGYAHSVEVWESEELVGGLYGLALGGYFSGESMFHRRGDASKIAVCALVEQLGRQGFELFDIQQSTPHCSRMGASEIGRTEYLQRLSSAVGLAVQFGVI
jgi:leucyl/phenylalanyl-tRNA--protein transferase